jgi:hypothetical protein
MDLVFISDICSIYARELEEGRRGTEDREKGGIRELIKRWLLIYEKEMILILCIKMVGFTLICAMATSYRLDSPQPYE